MVRTVKKKLQVFISSTYEDLREDRQAAVSAVLKAGHIPAGMELFTAGDKSQMDTIRRWIDESDVYMLILGGRYGSLENTSGVSYTELEYDYALEQQKSLFAVVIDEGALEERVKNIGSSVMEKDNPKQLKAFREKVLSNISSFFKDEKDISLCVYESLSDFAVNRELKGWVSYDEVVNCQMLLDEIENLKEENKTLKANKESKDNLMAKSDVGFEELRDTLKSIVVQVPGKLTENGEELEMNLLHVLNTSRDEFVTGVTNQATNGDYMTFLYFNIAPKLQIHGVVFNEKVAGVRWRRFSLTQKGMEFLARLDREKIEKNQQSSPKQ